MDLVCGLSNLPILIRLTLEFTTDLLHHVKKMRKEKKPNAEGMITCHEETAVRAITYSALTLSKSLQEVHLKWGEHFNHAPAIVLRS